MCPNASINIIEIIIYICYNADRIIYPSIHNIFETSI